MWRKPSRPDSAAPITQPFRDGTVRIYTVADGAAPGYRPAPVLHPLYTLRYDNRKLGLQRYFSARQNQVEVARVIRTPFRPDVSNQCVAITEDGEQYGIALVQEAMDVWPRSMDLTLTQIKQQYAVQTEEVVDNDP